MPDIAKALRSFHFAFKGILALFRTENNAKIHLIAGGIAVMLAFLLDFDRIEWCILILQIALVLAAEAFNSALEKLADLVSAEHHPMIGTLKDIAAGGVLITALASLITGMLLYLPKIIHLFT